MSLSYLLGANDLDPLLSTSTAGAAGRGRLRGPLAAAAVSRVGVRPRVDRGAAGGGRLAAPLGQQDEDGGQHGQHEDEARHGDADREAPLRYADAVGVVRRPLSGDVVEQVRPVEVVGLVHVQAGIHLDGGGAALLGLVLRERAASLPPPPGAVAGRGHVIAAVVRLEAQSHVALVVHGRGVRELVRLEADLRQRLGLGVLELAHDLVVDGAPLGVDEPLLAPAQAVADQAVGDAEAVQRLVVDVDGERERVADLDVLGHLLLRGVAVEDLHAAAGHGRRGRQRGRLRRADVDGVGDGLVPRLVPAPDVEATALVCHQLPVGLHHDRVEVLHPAVVQVGAHGVAGAQRQPVPQRALVLAELGEAGRVLGQPARVHHAVEHGIGVQPQLAADGDGDLVAVAVDADVLHQVLLLLQLLQRRRRGGRGRGGGQLGAIHAAHEHRQCEKESGRPTGTPWCPVRRHARAVSTLLLRHGDCPPAHRIDEVYPHVLEHSLHPITLWAALYPTLDTTALGTHTRTHARGHTRDTGAAREEESLSRTQDRGRRPDGAQRRSGKGP